MSKKISCFGAAILTGFIGLGALASGYLLRSTNPVETGREVQVRPYSEISSGDIWTVMEEKEDRMLVDEGGYSYEHCNIREYIITNEDDIRVVVVKEKEGARKEYNDPFNMGDTLTDLALGEEFYETSFYLEQDGLTTHYDLVSAKELEEYRRLTSHTRKIFGIPL